MRREKIELARKEAVEFVVWAELILAEMDRGKETEGSMEPLGNQAIMLRLTLEDLLKVE
jgi:hypothetical protein